MSEHTERIAQRVAELDPFEFDHYAGVAAQSLAMRGYTYVDLQPGDATTYKISIIRPREHRLVSGHVVFGLDDRQLHIATSFGPLYPWTPSEINDPGYIHSKWVSNQGPTGEHTAHVLARFLDTLCAAMKRLEEPDATQTV